MASAPSPCSSPTRSAHTSPASRAPPNSTRSGPWAPITSSTTPAKQIDDGGPRYDLIIDTGGRNKLSRLRRALTPSGTLVIVGGEDGDRLTGGIGRQLRAAASSPLVSQRLTFFVSSESGEDIAALADHLATGEVTPVIGQRFALDDVPAAIDAMEAGTLTGKAVVVMHPDPGDQLTTAPAPPAENARLAVGGIQHPARNATGPATPRLWEGRTFGALVLAAFGLYGTGSALADTPLGVTLVALNSLAVTTVGVLGYRLVRAGHPGVGAGYLGARAAEAALLLGGVLVVQIADLADADTVGYQLGMLALGVGSVPFFHTSAKHDCCRAGSLAGELWATPPSQPAPRSSSPPDFPSPSSSPSPAACSKSPSARTCSGEDSVGRTSPDPRADRDRTVRGRTRWRDNRTRLASDQPNMTGKVTSAGTHTHFADKAGKAERATAATATTRITGSLLAQLRRSQWLVPRHGNQTVRCRHDVVEEEAHGWAGLC